MEVKFLALNPRCAALSRGSRHFSRFRIAGYKRKSFTYSLAISRGTWRLFGEPVNLFLVARRRSATRQAHRWEVPISYSHDTGLAALEHHHSYGIARPHEEDLTVVLSNNNRPPGGVVSKQKSRYCRLPLPCQLTGCRLTLQITRSIYTLHALGPRMIRVSDQVSTRSYRCTRSHHRAT